ncbi:MAG: S8 family peptidase [Myxococcaceae bacterium]
MRRFVSVGLVLAAVGCGGDDHADDEFGKIVGELRVKLSSFVAALSVPTTGTPSIVATETGNGTLLIHGVQPLLEIPNEERILPGEILVRFEDGARDAATALSRLQVSGYVGAHAGWASREIHLLRFKHADGTELDSNTTREMATKLAGLPGVRWTTLNRIHVPTAVPNDPLFLRQWHYATMNLPSAWDIGRESPGVVVAVVDTGIAPHPDLVAQILPGVDVVSDPRVAMDGDGRDMDPNDPGGDLAEGRSSWHGSHVAGTVGATSNNTLGVAGVSLNARILPVRALGRNGGATADVLAGIVWAIGEEVPGLQPNVTPAQVINLSLGTVGNPDPAYQEVINRAVGRGVVFVIAAGNESLETRDRIPCNQDNVLCIGAARLNGTRATYSNFGPQIDLLAPGGQGVEDLNADDLPDAILSTYFDETRSPAYAFLQGTSMAAPHIAGLVALMKAVNPALGHLEIEQILRATSASDFACAEGCGAGLVNAQTALLRAAGLSAPGGTGSLFLPASQLLLIEASATRIPLINTGGAPLDVSVSFTTPQPGLKLELAGGGVVRLAPGEAKALLVNVTVEELPAGDYEGVLTFTPNEGTAQAVPVRARTGAQGTAGTAIVALLNRSEDGAWSIVAASPAMPYENYRYSIGVKPGLYYVGAGIDDNGNGRLFDAGERSGFFPDSENPQQVRVLPGQTIEDIDFVIAPVE